MFEVEVKVRAELGPVRARLQELGAESSGTVTQVDTYYDHPGRDFGATDEALRIRRDSQPRADDARAVTPEGAAPTTTTGAGSSESPAADPEDRLERTFLTYKGPLVDDRSKTRSELETTVGDADGIDAILGALGFASVATVEKRRERYDLKGYLVTLDRVAGLGSFVEVEAAGEAAAVDRLHEGAHERLRELGLDPEGGIRTSYLELLLAGADNRE